MFLYLGGEREESRDLIYSVWKDLNYLMYKKNRRTWALLDLASAIKISCTWMDVARLLCIAASGSSYRLLKSEAIKNDLDFSHFLGQSWSKGKKLLGKNRLSLEEVMVENSTYTTQSLKNRLFKEGIKSKFCEWCLLDTWRNQPISLELDHINGISNDNRLENLRILCPNCHAQTDTYRGRNLKRKLLGEPAKTQYFCGDCGSSVTKKNVKCRSCFKKGGNYYKIDWPSLEELLARIQSSSQRRVAKELGVSDTAVKLHIRRSLRG